MGNHSKQLNASFTKPLGTHTFYQGGLPDSPYYFKNRFPHETEILSGIRDIFQRFRNVKVVYIVFIWLP